MAIILNCFVVVFMLCLSWHITCATPKLFEMVDVHNELPGHIAFTFYNDVGFVPTKLQANVTSHRQKLVFMSIGDREKKTFRNIAPQNLSVLDVVTGQLIYQQSEDSNSPRREVTFQYLIPNKRSDTFSIDLRSSRPLPLSSLPYEAETALPSSSCNTKVTPVEIQTPQPPPACPVPPPCNASESTDARIEYLERLLNTTLEHTQFDKRLLLQMGHPPQLNAVDNIRNIISDRLNLPHLRYSILQAKYIDEGLLFEMASPRETLEVLTQVRQLSNKNRIRITPTERNFFEVSTFFRMSHR